ncbi:conserved hypothetical protein [Trichinella spiralis]|uniref:hypothetical protein n=1 Tax=Trichinella spiralis TaxID=6334 RepID=UPI0001EFD573|nr:conserved hypothetical protein [Trichinella spiralis]
MVNSCLYHCGTTLKVPSMPQVRMAASSLMLESVAITSETRNGENLAEKTKPIPAIYDEKASTASAEPSTSGHFSLFKRVKSTMYSHWAKRYPKLPSHCRDLEIPSVTPVAPRSAVACLQ